jgi:hypothetical protein
MVFTAAQVTLFFEAPDQMAITHRTRLKLAEEGIDHPSDLLEFTKEGFKKLAESLKYPDGRVPNPDAGAPAGAMIITPRYALGAKSWLRLEAAADLVRYFETCGRPLTNANMQWSPVIKYHHEYEKALATQLTDSPPELPKITKALPIMRWVEAIENYFARMNGARSVPLTYVTRESVAVEDPIPPLLPGKPYSEKYGSVEDELVALASHTHALYRIDNATVYYALKLATQATAYAASVTPFDASKDGRGAYLALTSQFAGPDKWHEELRKQKEFLQNRKWTGQSSMTLETFVSQHRQAHVMMSQCALHIHVELPTPYSRVTSLLDAIDSTDSRLQSALSHVRTDSSLNGLHHNFESTVTVLIPQDPVARNRKPGGKRTNGEISALAGILDPVLKLGKGKTGVALRFHIHSEYKKLNQEQKDELEEVRTARQKAGFGRDLPGGHRKKKDANGKKRKHKKDGKPDIAAMIAAAVSHLPKKPKAEPTKASALSKETRTKMIIALLDGHEDKPAESGAEVSFAAADEPAPAPTVEPALELKSILRKAKHG